MAFSRDMLDTNFGDMAFPPKWRTSLTVYYYVVPEEETADAYPESRIVYLKLSCSITGWNPSEELLETKKQASESDQWDDLQKSIWEVIEASSWASKYWGCHGAIMQIGVFPGKADQVGPDDYPYIIDFEPKKRELYETVSEGGELLAGSSENISLSKGSTSTKSVTAEAGWSPPLGIGGFGAKASGTVSKQTIENKTTDTSREDRETKSHSTTFSQLYQLFNGYHLGTNRATFVVAPRPHTVSGTFNLIDGERKLEGIQDMFLVVTMPRSLKGFCIHASIDTGHKHPDEQAASSNVRRAYALRTVDFSDPPCLGGVITQPQPPGGGGGGGGTPPDDGDGFSFIVTRRMVQACGQFNEQGQLDLEKLPAGNRKPPHVFVGEHFIPTRAMTKMMMARTNTGGAPEGGFDDCRPTAAALYNYNISRMNKAMLSMFSAGAAKPRSFNDTNTFKTLFVEAANQLKVSIDELHRLNYVSDDELRLLKQYRVGTLSDLFKPSTDNISNVNLNAIRDRIVNKRR